MLTPGDFFDLKDCPYRSLFEGVEFVWDGLSRIPEFLSRILQPNANRLAAEGPVVSETRVLHEDRVIKSGFRLLPGDVRKGDPAVQMDGQVLAGASVIHAGAVLMNDQIQIGKNTVVEPGALIAGPAVIGDNTEVRQGAYIRGKVLVGNGCVVGHATEVKSAALLGGSQAGHFAYIGDSILGKVNLGAGTKLANLKIVRSGVIVYAGGKQYETGLRKFGAIIGDGVETGCNSVTSPGTLLGRNVRVYPNCTVRGFHPEGTVVKLKQDLVVRKMGKTDE